MLSAGIGKASMIAITAQIVPSSAAYKDRTLRLRATMVERTGKVLRKKDTVNYSRLHISKIYCISAIVRVRFQFDRGDP